MKFRHPLWLVGFRPFFALAMCAGVILPPVWVAIVTGSLPLPYGLARSPVVWHAHEMLYGFGWAVLAGFLLTATKNWVGVRGWHGAALALLAACWVVERIALAVGAAWPGWLFVPAATAFVGFAVVLILLTLLRHRATDSYRSDNVYFYLVLPLFIPAKLFLLSPDGFSTGVAMSLALFRMAFLLMLERTLAPFMKGAFQVELPRILLLDHGIKLSALMLVASPWLAAPVAGVVAGLFAVLMLIRWTLWYPQRALSRLDIGIMAIGSAAMIVHAALLAVDAFVPQAGIGRLATHVFTLGTIGAIAPAMMVRIARGHTGRKVVFDGVDKASLWLMLLALVFRVVLTSVAPELYFLWLWLAAGAWALAFGSLAWRYVPMLLAPRVDGREH